MTLLTNVAISAVTTSTTNNSKLVKMGKKNNKSTNHTTSSSKRLSLIILIISLMLLCSQLQIVLATVSSSSSSSSSSDDPLNCASFSDCFNCLTIGGIGTEVNGSSCSWCSLTMNCIPQESHCINSTIHAVGKMGIRKGNNAKSSFYNTIVVSSKAEITQQESILNNCSSRIDSLDQCVLGSQFAKIYIPVSTSTRNLQPGGLPAQPILPITKEFLEAYIVSDIALERNITPKLVTEYMHQLAYNGKNTILVGAYMIESPKKVRTAKPFTMFSSIGYKGFKANYTLDAKTNKLTVRKGKLQDSVILHLLPTNIGLHAPRGKYRMGVVVALQNEKISDQPKCLFYPIPDPISVKPVYQDVVVGIYLYAGIPVFLIGIVLIIIYSKFCPFADSKKLSQATYEEREKRELEDLKRTDNTIGESEAVGAAVNEKRHHFSLRWFWKVNSDQVISQSGLRGYYYWKFYRRLVLIVFLYGLLAMTILLPINIVNNKRLHGVVDFAVTTFGSIARNGSTSIAHYVIGIVFFLITVVIYAFSIRLAFYKRRYETSIFTARLRHLPDLHIKLESDSSGRFYVANPEDIALREKLLTQHFNNVMKKVLIADANESIQPLTTPVTDNTSSTAKSSVPLSEADVPDPVLSVNVIADMSHILSDLDTQYQLEQTIDESNGKKSILGRVKKKRLKTSRKSMLEKIQKKPIVTNQVFITFRSALALRRCKMIYKSNKNKSRTTTKYSDEISCGVDSWKMRQVTWEPEDVEWDHIYDSTRRNVYATLFVYMIYFISYLILIGALLIYFFRYGVYGLHSSLHYKQAFYLMDSGAVLKNLIPVVLGFASSVFSVFLTIAGEIANVIMRMVTGHERMKSKSKTSASYLLKSVFIIIPFYLTIPFLGDYQVAQMHPESFYNNVGLALMQFVLSYLFLYKGLELLICVVKITISYIQTGGEPERIPFDFNVAYTSALTNFFIIAVTGIRIPLLYIPGVAFFVMSYLVDTFLLLFFYERAVGTGRIEFSLVTALLLVFGAAAMLAHPSLSVLLAFGSIVFVAVSLSIICVIVYIYNRRGTRKSTHVQVQDEGAYANKYCQPHLKILLRKPEDIEMPDVQLGGDSASAKHGSQDILCSPSTEAVISESVPETVVSTTSMEPE